MVLILKGDSAMTKMHWSLLAGVSMVACLLFGGACSRDTITASMIRQDMSPEMESMALTHGQRLNRRAKVWDVNARQIWDDIDVILLEDRPLRLSRYPVP